MAFWEAPPSSLISLYIFCKGDIRVAESSRGLLESEVRAQFPPLAEADIGYKFSSSNESHSEYSRKLSIACLLYSNCDGYLEGLQIKEKSGVKNITKAVDSNIIHNK